MSDDDRGASGTRAQWHPPDLSGRVALVAGATRGAGRAVAVELGAGGATVYCSGRSSRSGRSDLDRPETIEGTAERVTAAGGTGVAVRVDHSDEAHVAALFERVRHEQGGRLDLLVTDIWGGDPLTEWGTPFWEMSLAKGRALLERAVWAHIVTDRYGAGMMVERGSGLLIEVTDGDSYSYRGTMFYDLAKTAAIRLAQNLAIDLEPHGVTALAITPGFLRSEAMLDHFGVSEATWREAVAQDRHFIASETPHYLGRAIASLAADPQVERWRGQALSTWGLREVYGLMDTDGARPDWGAYARKEGFFGSG